jgi:aspartyl-tRNA(Asn)/glutamyl-tRNA(Gln) amidotransferase subunit B
MMSAPSLRHATLSAATVLIASRISTPRACIVAKWLGSRGLTTAPDHLLQDAVPLRKHLKDEARKKKSESRLGAGKSGNDVRVGHQDSIPDKWELTVGVEIHAELNSTCKLFSTALAADPFGNEGAGADGVNTRVALFDAAMPGAQPQFQIATLLPAIRAAVALGCTVQHKSGWDRKHYFHWDQPNGYQITQYYEPFAKDGSITLTADDGVPQSDLNGAESLTIGIKQVQMEQDTAKTTHYPPSTYHIDFNRSGHPLIEIITLPQIHSPQTAAAVVRKIQAILRSVDSCVTGMEFGGLRADVNVSIRERGTEGTASSYAGVSGLGQRTEIKNLSSFKAVEDAIIAERTRQVAVLEAGGVIAGETRGWSLGATETTRLRGKEGEVDYRYMPDADLPPLLISSALVKHLKETLPELPDQTVIRVQEAYGLSLKDAKTLVSLDDGDRLEYLEETVRLVLNGISARGTVREDQSIGAARQHYGRIAGNWILHEIGGLLSANSASSTSDGDASFSITDSWTTLSITPIELAAILVELYHDRTITTRAAKSLLATLYTTPIGSGRPTVEQIITDSNLRLRHLSDSDYEILANAIIEQSPDMVKAVRKAGKAGGKKAEGKIMWFVGQMVRKGEEEGGMVEPESAKEVVGRLLSQGE